jgi:hypothetical protein
MRSPRPPGPDRQGARNKGLDRLTGVTLGAAVVSLAGAAGIGVALYTSNALQGAEATTVAPFNPANPHGDGFGTQGPGPGSNPENANPGNGNPDDSGPDDSSQAGPGPQFQPGEPPSRSDLPPGATSGGS